MRVPTDLKYALIERFTPLLYLDRDEPDYPVSPVEYVESAALWTSTPPDHVKSGWGKPAGADRVPLIEHKGISLNPAHDVEGTADPDGDGVPEYYLGHQDQERGGYPYLAPEYWEVWFDICGWQDDDHVSAGSKNRRTDPGPRPSLSQPWFSADVWSTEELLEQLPPEQLAARFGLNPADRSEKIEGVVAVAFHFLFPLHRQRRRGTESDPDDDQYTGDYEGDWASFTVIGRLDTSLSETTTAGELTPLYGAFGQRWRGMSQDYEDLAAERLVLRPWASMLAVGDHPVVVAASGTHNLHPHDPPLHPDGTIRPQWIDFGLSQSEPANSYVRDSTEEPWSPVFAIKVLAGFLLGGPIGLLVGLAAVEAEASWAEEEGLFEPPKLDPSPPPEQDNPLADDAADLEKQNVATPLGISTPPLIDPVQSEVREWEVTPEEALVDDLIVLAPYGSGHRPSYTGRWGVRCHEDQFLRRSGIRVPAYRALVIDAILTQT